MDKLVKRFLCTAERNRYSKPVCRWVLINDVGLIDGVTPVEDFGMYWITNMQKTPEQAEKFFNQKLKD
jgi:hypothetical protein